MCRYVIDGKEESVVDMVKLHSIAGLYRQDEFDKNSNSKLSTALKAGYLPIKHYRPLNTP
jgi:hypothetical protein